MIKLTYTPPMKTCITCGCSKPETEFYRASYTGIVGNQCKTCVTVKRACERHKSKHGKFISKEKQRNMEVPDYVYQDWKDVMVHFAGSCAFCGAREGRASATKMDRDHLIAISKGGKTVRANIIPACRKCNRGRGNKDWLEWFKAQDFFNVDRAKRIIAWASRKEESNE
jgi:5-methylcytosine-specific restriction endonuclease McrA